MHGDRYAGGAYAYMLVNKMMMAQCRGANRIKIPSTINPKKISMEEKGTEKIAAQIDSLLGKTPGQGVGATINVFALQDAHGPHAVNFIGCRTIKGKKEYLVHNSWGTGCQSYHEKLQGPDKCINGRVWIPADTLLNFTREIQWLEK